MLELGFRHQLSHIVIWDPMCAVLKKQSKKVLKEEKQKKQQQKNKKQTQHGIEFKEQIIFRLIE